MSDQDPPAPKDEESPEEDAPPPMEDEQEESAELAESTELEESVETEEPGGEDVDAVAAGGSNVLGKGTLSESDEKTMGMLAHLLGGITCVIGPLLIWLIKREESPFVNDQGKEALNFQITVFFAYLASGLLGVLTGGCAIFILYPAIMVASLIFAILGGLEANKGIIYRYPFALRLIN